MRGLKGFLRLAGCAITVGLALATNCGADEKAPIHEPPPLPPQAKEMDVKELAKLLKERKDIAILDVRSVEEVKTQGSIPGAKHLDYFSPDFTTMLPQLGIDVNKPCLVYCAFGGRARRAAQRLATLGCKEILLPKGGFTEWKKAGEPVEGGSGH